MRTSTSPADLFPQLDTSIIASGSVNVHSQINDFSGTHDATGDADSIFSIVFSVDTPQDWSARDGNFVTLLGNRRLGAVELAADLGYRDQLSRANYVSLSSYSEARLRSLSFDPILYHYTQAGHPITAEDVDTGLLLAIMADA